MPRKNSGGSQSQRGGPESPPRRSRWRLAWRVLLGEPVVPESILGDWLSYRLLFDDLLTRFSALLARQAKAEQKRLRDQLDESQPPSEQPSSQETGKQRARRKAAELRGFSVHRPAPSFGNLALSPSPQVEDPESYLDQPPEEDEEP